MSRRGALLAAALAAAAAFAWTPGVVWDLQIYAACARELRAGGDPYARNVLVEGERYPCMYPPLAIDLYRPVTALMDYSPGLGVRVWNALQVLFFLCQLWIWRRWFLGEGLDAARVLFALVGFGGPLFVALHSGNGAMFESLLLWSAFALFAAGRDLPFVLAVAAAAMIKLQPAVFFVVALLRPRPAWRYFFLGGAAFVILFALNETAHPGLLLAFRARLADTSHGWRFERGPNNCAVLGFFQHVFETSGIDRTMAAHWSRGLFLPWALFVAAATGASLRRIWAVAKDEAAARRATLLLACAAYALLAPRFKDYGYMILIPSALAALESDIPNGLRAAIVVLALLNSTKAVAEQIGMGRWAMFAGYFKLYASVLVWGVLARRPFTDRKALE